MDGARSSGAMPFVSVTAERIDIAAEIAEMAGGGSGNGAVAGAIGGLVTFSGYCRDEGGTLAALELEHYPGMAELQIARVAREACERWPLLACRAIHRHGLVRPGDEIVLVACASAHRDAAFQAASFLMDYLKTSAPFWKREHRIDGSLGAWVAAKDTDAAAAERWATG